MDLQIDEDLPFQRRGWAVERAGWVVLVALVAAALAGLFGSGPLSGTQRRSPGGTVEVDYPRFVRYGTPLSVDVTLRPDGDQAELAVSGRYLERFSLDQVTPDPSEVRSAADALVFVFPLAGDAGEVHATFGLTAGSAGSASGEFSLAGGERVEVRQFVYP